MDNIVTRTVICIGRNYAKHAAELNNAVPTSPFYFLKPPSTIIREGAPILLRPGHEVHHEVELAVVIGKRARRVASSDAMDYVSGYCLALDLTARNVQAKAKAKGLPWSEAKGYETFCPIGPFVPKSAVTDVSRLRLTLKVDDQVRQDGETGDMIFSVPQLIEHVSGIFPLSEGDLLLTGTPEGVGPLTPGQRVHAQLREAGDGGALLSEMHFDAVEDDGGR